MTRCEVVEVRNLADAAGLACLRTASKQCSDCGAELCDLHAETCGMCRAMFCPPCLTFRQEQHPKAARQQIANNIGSERAPSPVALPLTHREFERAKENDGEHPMVSANQNSRLANTFFACPEFRISEFQDALAKAA